MLRRTYRVGGQKVREEVSDLALGDVAQGVLNTSLETQMNIFHVTWIGSHKIIVYGQVSPGKARPNWVLKSQRKEYGDIGDILPGSWSEVMTKPVS